MKIEIISKKSTPLIHILLTLFLNDFNFIILSPNFYTTLKLFKLYRPLIKFYDYLLLSYKSYFF